MEWRFLDTGRAPGALNMAIDEAIATLHGGGRSPSTIRLYGWDPACLSVGYSQSVERDVDVERCRSLGVDLVRRPTGGRAVLHDDELTYSLVVAEDNPLIKGGITESYRRISLGLLAGLARLSIAAEMAPSRTSRGAQYRSAACFDSPSTYEVTVGGRKLVGSAQVRRRGVVLQHGSLLLSFDRVKLLSLLKLGAGDRSDLGHELNEKVTSLEAVARQKVTFGEVAEALRAGFEEALGVGLALGKLTEEEEALARQLAREKYATREWNFRK